MSIEGLTGNWALWVAILPAAIVGAALVWAWFRKSAAGKLRRTLGDHREALRLLADARQSIETAESRVRKLTDKAQKVKPRLLQEAKEALEDARALAKIADDKVQVTANQVRRTIYEEFPPTDHDRLRARYLPQDMEDKRPFSF